MKERAVEVLNLLPQSSPELVDALRGISSPGALADLVAGMIDIKPAERQVVLETLDLMQRQDVVLDLLAKRREVLRLSREIDQRTQENMNERQREYLCGNS